MILMNAENLSAEEKEELTRQYFAELDKILKKVGEECAETLLAAKDVEYAGGQSSSQKTALVYETADLWFHTLVMLSHCGLSAEDVLVELAKRFDLSGLAEKAARPH